MLNHVIINPKLCTLVFVLVNGAGQNMKSSSPLVDHDYGAIYHRFTYVQLLVNIQHGTTSPISPAVKVDQNVDNRLVMIIDSCEGGKDTSACLIWCHSSRVLNKMLGNLTFDQFDKFKWCHMEENPPTFNYSQFRRWSGYISMPNFMIFPLCILREMPGTPKFDPFTRSKLGKYINIDHNLTTSQGGQDTSACKMSGHFFHAFSRKYPETPKFDPFHSQYNVKMSKNQ